MPAADVPTASPPAWIEHELMLQRQVLNLRKLFSGNTFQSFDTLRCLTCQVDGGGNRPLVEVQGIVFVVEICLPDLETIFGDEIPEFMTDVERRGVGTSGVYLFFCWPSFSFLFKKNNIVNYALGPFEMNDPWLN